MNKAISKETPVAPARAKEDEHDEDDSGVMHREMVPDGLI